MHILIIGYVWPEPNSSAAGAYIMQLIEQFRALSWQVSFASPAARTEHSSHLSDAGIHEYTIALNCSSFDRWIQVLQPDMVVFDRFMMEEQFGWRVAEQCPQALRVLASIDLHSLRETRHQALKTFTQTDDSTFPDQSLAELYTAMATQDVTQREIAAIYRCDLTLLLSDVERDLLVYHFKVPDSLLCYCPFMLDNPDTCGWPTFDDRQDFVSIGNFLHNPNWDAVLWLKQTIWPLIHRTLPQSRLHIYGAYAPQKALDLHNPAQGFYVCGRADDAITVIRQARVCLAPLRFGAGIKGKLADALLCGTPSVTTSLGSEGMALGAVWGGAVANHSVAFASAAVSLYQNPTQWRQAQQNGLATLRARFDKQQVGKQLIRQLENCLLHRDERRTNNFTGLMLQHHAHKSTKYMARWIEAKNQLPQEKPPGL